MLESEIDKHIERLENRSKLFEAVVDAAIAGEPWRETYWDEMNQFGIQPEQVLNCLKEREKYKGALGWIRRKRDSLIQELIGCVEGAF